MMTDDFDGYLYRAVEARFVEEILASGVSSERATYWGTHSIASYYAETIEDEGEEPVIIRAEIEAFNADFLEPDQPGIDEPISFLIGMKEQAIYDAWIASDGSWKSSLDLIGSVRYRGDLPAAALSVDEEV
jgi:hypothetical protein